MLLNQNYNPDVLSCLANLSNDEVFTPPDVANQMLDLLPEDIWKNEKTKFLDPVSKSGIFLREITKRLIKGLEDKIPNLEKRINHIFQNQLYGIAITELTSLLSRRSLYCSKDANGKYSISNSFTQSDGNIRFKKMSHEWKGQKCKFCGASKDQYERSSDLETHAYEFIHKENPEEIFEMKFDVIIGNPPYQLGDGGSGASASPIYQNFINQAKKLMPQHLIMIVPARWYAGGKGLNQFREEMLADRRLKKLVDFQEAGDVFPNVEIKGGVCYFHWEKNYNGDCEVVSNSVVGSDMMKRKLNQYDVFVRLNKAIPILSKVLKFKNPSFSSLISSRKPFGLSTNFNAFKKDYFDGSIRIYANNKRVGFIDRNKLPFGESWVNKNKIFLSKAYNGGYAYPHQIINKPIIPSNPSCCTETYLCIGPFESEEETLNVYNYLNTKIARFLIYLRKITQDNTKDKFEFLPKLDFKLRWTDKNLCDHFKINNDEFDLINQLIRPMEDNEDG